VSRPLRATMKMETQYHVFTHGQDEWFGEDELVEAKKLYHEWAQEHGSARLYVETYIDEELDNEDCLMSVGAYPW